MVRSIVKTSAIIAGSAMLASTLATGAFAVEQIGDVEDFSKKVVVEGNPNVNIVVGSNANAGDVISAAEITAKVGNLLYTEQSADVGSAKLNVRAFAKSDDYNLVGNKEVTLATKDDNALFVAAADGDYADLMANTAYFGDDTDLDAKDGAVSLGRLSTLAEVKDTDPFKWFDNDNDAYEFLMGRVTKENNDKWAINENELSYAVLSFKDDNTTFKGLDFLCPGKEIPFLGENYIIMSTSGSKDVVVLGKEVYQGVIKEGDTYAVNGLEVKVDSVLVSNAGTTNEEYKIKLQILKDGKVIAEKFDNAPTNLMAGGIGVRMFKAWKDIGNDYGFVELVVTDNLKCMPLGEEYIPDWETYVVIEEGNKLVYTDDIVKGVPNRGIALKYVGDDHDSLSSGKEIDILKYASMNFDDDDDKANTMNVLFEMDTTKDLDLTVGSKGTVLNSEIALEGIEGTGTKLTGLKAPLAVLDEEISLESADKNLIVVGGPVVNALSKELKSMGKINLTEESQATLAVVNGVANGNDVLVVAGGNTKTTNEAAKAFVELL
ncbi:S-layer protein (TIGR01564 family) [Methanococcus voltae]|uniref:S-layer protein (TIGR01564 family) n=2 Tax=Methanococcus voltae TaxID=2188 RepID=A0A8J7RIF4_METVO|nr:S-layer protein [Methanococcus voltae]MBP2201491.1 S-layer protein (TIGR01564 family) [Methanococcus voltae]MCS3922280.1 S-layer protein (TIGR01564 family) [Methanococcus voltae PS]